MSKEDFITDSAVLRLEKLLNEQIKIVTANDDYFGRLLQARHDSVIIEVSREFEIWIRPDQIIAIESKVVVEPHLPDLGIDLRPWYKRFAEKVKEFGDKEIF